VTLFHLSLLAIVQGITEFLPISSSAHLVLLHELGGPGADALALDIAVHLGSIVAVILYFRSDALRAARGTVQLARGQLATPEAFLALCLLVATVPALLFGAVLAVTGWVDLLRNTVVIGWMMILFGIALWWVHRTAPEARPAESWTLRHAVVIGLWQAVALIPGVSRSGITMTAARGLGYERHAAARIALLMSIPITLATGALLGLRVLRSPVGPELLANAAIAAVLSFAAAYLALALMMRFLDRVSFTPYIVYRIALGVVLLWIAYV
jgi:undecaprenyl-diphosphatase